MTGRLKRAVIHLLDHSYFPLRQNNRPRARRCVFSLTRTQIWGKCYQLSDWFTIEFPVLVGWFIDGARKRRDRRGDKEETRRFFFLISICSAECAYTGGRSWNNWNLEPRLLHAEQFLGAKQTATGRLYERYSNIPQEPCRMIYLWIHQWISPTCNRFQIQDASSSPWHIHWNFRSRELSLWLDPNANTKCLSTSKEVVCECVSPPTITNYS